MTGHYKEEHKYTIDLIKLGYKHIETFADTTSIHFSNPNGFKMPNTLNGWEWRRKIKEYLVNHPHLIKNKGYKIVKGSGYWTDLTNIAYELWVKKMEERASSHS